MESKTGPILIGLAYLGLVVFIMLFCADQTSSFDDYSKYWGLFGTLIGVTTGAIPTFFFKAQADQAGKKADAATERANKESSKAQLFAGAVEPHVTAQIKADNPTLFM
ncbi:hypothetical protein AB0I34_08070 [Kribbella sp. NPDC050281]|uniref:hypothetical protein n=1 Tax=Kribbella sp. NPDC050281 TaxID=3155515 RepID=UPI0033C554F4